MPSQFIARVTHTAEVMRTTTEIVCNPPTTVFQQWDINTIVPGIDGQPSPIEYTLEHKKPHRLSVIDIDARDMQLGVYVDGVMRGLTTEFELDKSVNCGEDVQTCLNLNFSGGIIVVPPGRHTIKIVWAGKGKNIVLNLAHNDVHADTISQNTFRVLRTLIGVIITAGV